MCSAAFRLAALATALAVVPRMSATADGTGLESLKRLVDAGDPARAIDQLTAEVASNPAHEAARMLLAEAYEKTGKHDEAMTTWEDAVAEITGEGGPFEIVDSEIRGVAVKVFKNTPPSLRAALQIARTRPDDIFLVYEDERLTFGQVISAVDELACTTGRSGSRPRLPSSMMKRVGYHRRRSIGKPTQVRRSNNTASGRFLWRLAFGRCRRCLFSS